MMDIIENGMVNDNVGLNFSEPDSIIGQNHVYDLLFLCEYGPPSSFQIHLINVVLFFFEHFLFLYLHLDLGLSHELRLFLLLLLPSMDSPSHPHYSSSDSLHFRSEQRRVGKDAR